MSSKTRISPYVLGGILLVSAGAIAYVAAAFIGLPGIPERGRVVSFTDYRNGLRLESGFGGYRAGQHVVRRPKDAATLPGTLDTARVDFIKNLVVVIIGGSRSSIDTQLVPERVVEDAEHITVRYKNITAGKGCATLQAIFTPSLVLLLPQSSKSISFEQTSVTRNCR